jgi:DnaJ homolog subfamily B member 12
MEVNKDEAERCKIIGANAMKQKEYARATKFFRKSLSLYPLPGVEALLAQAELMETNGDSNTDGSASGSAANGTTSPVSPPSPPNNRNSQTTTSTGRTAAGSSSHNNADGRNGRNYTQAQVDIVETILRAKAQGGRTAHYSVLSISPTQCTEADIKKAYRKLAVKVHPDKNSAPKADEAFKAVGLAYATLSDPQKKAIYDRYGDEDPDNRGGGGSGSMRHRGPGGMHFRPGDEVSPEDIFNMFFGGGMPGGAMHRGPGGMHFYTNFGGPAGFGRTQQQQQQRRRGSQQQQTTQDETNPGLASLMQLLPFFLILILSFLNMNDYSSQGHSGTASTRSPGQNRYFSLTVRPFSK